MLRIVIAAGLAALCFVPTLAVWAETGSPATDAGRYTMSPADGGVVRLDRQSGAMSFCTKQGSEWRCEAMSDGQQTLRDEATRLEKENEALKAEKKHLEEMLGLGAPADGAAPGLGSPGGSMKVPDEKDVDQMFDYLEGMIKKFKERLQKLEDRPGTEQPL
jgi:hypothetical protein